jgi:hypothetical protein
MSVVALLAFAGEAAAERTPPENLLHATPSAIRVSSTVANKNIPPQGIADGDPRTAWNSRTGKLVGETIEIRVPASAWVKSIRMTVGFTTIDDKLGDLFVMNQRIKKVRVYRNGTLLKEQTFDIENRDLQAIPIEQEGGDFKIELAELVAGTKKNWREAAISELDVIGYPSADDDVAPSWSFYPATDVGTLATSTITYQAYDKVTPPAVLVRVPTTKVLAIAIGEGPRAFETRGDVVELDRYASNSIDRLAALVRIVETPTQKKAWIGRRLQLQGADAKSCGGTVRELAVIGHYTTAHGAGATIREFIAAWKPGDMSVYSPGLLVALVEPDLGASCTDALWATAPDKKVIRGKLEKKKYREKIFTAFFTGRTGYTQLDEAYQLNDLDGEYSDASENEKKIPKDQRFSEALVRKTFEPVSGCIGTSCLGVISGTYNSRSAFDALTLDNNTPGPIHRVDSSAATSALGVADVDGDGAADLIFSASNEYEARETTTLFVLHDGQYVSVGLREWGWGFGNLY